MKILCGTTKKLKYAIYSYIVAKELSSRIFPISDRHKTFTSVFFSLILFLKIRVSENGEINDSKIFEQFFNYSCHCV